MERRITLPSLYPLVYSDSYPIVVLPTVALQFCRGYFFVWLKFYPGVIFRLFH
jgi:hypothetical protein